MIYVDLFLTFAKIGLLGFGGGIAMLPIIYQNALSLGDITTDEFSNLVGISQITPGPIAVNAATYVGYHLAGFPGTMVATIGVALPSFIFVTVASYFLEKFKESRIVEGALAGARPASVGLMASALLFMGSQAIVSGPAYSGLIALGVCLVSLFLIAKVNMHPLLVVTIAGIFGAVFMS